MSIRIMNTLGREKQAFTPITPGKVTVYACGVTTYELCHIGHGRAAVVFDVAVRHLRHRGFEVTYARNYTDVDDKIIRKANQEGVDAAEIGERYVQAAREDMLALGCMPPDVEPRVTTTIPQIIQFVQGLVDAGKAYPADNGDVYYAVESFPEYGKLSGKRTEDLIAGARVDVIEDKRSPVDFALWKAAKPGEPSWESPWGDGRPGWHIECSAMCAEHLGTSIDIHGGGSDLIFPHHENEIAQSEGLHGAPLANYWMHNGMITIDKEKMSKSIGNIRNIREVLTRYHREAVRLFYLSTHYRSPIDYSAQSLEEAEAALERLYMAFAIARSALRSDEGAEAAYTEAVASIETSGSTDDIEVAVGRALGEVPDVKALTPAEAAVFACCKDAIARFDEALDDDFNSARALGGLFEIAREVRRYATAHRRGTQNGFKVLLPAALLLKGLGAGRLGLLTETPKAWQGDLNRRRLSGRGVKTSEIDALVQARAKARDEKDWGAADRIRDALKGHGVTVEDSPEGTIWRVEATVEIND